MTQEQHRRRQHKIRQEQRRRKQLQRLIGAAVACIAASFFLGCIVGIKICSYSHDKEVGNDAEEISADQTGTDEITVKKPAEIAASLNDVPNITVPAPAVYSYNEAISVLTQRVESDSRYQTIVDNADEYPQKLLIHLANNPEMLSFVAEYDVLSTESTRESLTEEELAEEYPLFLQWDKRWGAHSYGDGSNIAVSGCGPTALAMAIVALTSNAAATPAKVADFAMSEGYYMYGTGTMWSLMTDGAASYGLDSEQIGDVNEQAIEACLDAGGLVICSMRAGDFTTAGHFILIYGYDAQGFSVNDPFCVYRSTKQWMYEDLEGQIKAAWTVF